jgi:hypothetical protein
MASTVQARRWHAPALHVKSTGQSAVEPQAWGAQRCVGPHVWPTPHEASVVQPGVHVVDMVHAHGARMQMIGGPPSAGQSASLVQSIPCGKQGSQPGKPPGCRHSLGPGQSLLLRHCPGASPPPAPVVLPEVVLLDVVPPEVALALAPPVPSRTTRPPHAAVSATPVKRSRPGKKKVLMAPSWTAAGMAALGTPPSLALAPREA